MGAAHPAQTRELRARAGGSVPKVGVDLEQLKQQMPRTPLLHLRVSRREMTPTSGNEHTTVRAFYGGKG